MGYSQKMEHEIAPIWTYLKANQVFFQIGDYPMSSVEFFGTVLSLSSVWLAGRGKILNWPLGILGASLFGALFYQLQLYADFFEQIYYVGASFYGWWLWSFARGPEKNLNPRFSSLRTQLPWIAATVVLSAVCSWGLTKIHFWLPRLFPEPASLPYVDGLTTVASFVAMILMAQGRIECWIYWIVINIISIALYSVKGVYFIALLYGIYLILGFVGLQRWVKLKEALQKGAL